MITCWKHGQLSEQCNTCDCDPYGREAHRLRGDQASVTVRKFTVTWKEVLLLLNLLRIEKIRLEDTPNSEYIRRCDVLIAKLKG